MKDITTIGEILIDLTQTGVSGAGIPQFDANPGGAPANVAVAASRLGASTAFWGKAGEDGFGAYLRRVLEDSGVNCAGLLTGRQAGSALLEEQGVRLVLVTLGGDGVFCRWQGQTWCQPGVSVKVADTNGAGDTFLGAVLSRLCRREAENPLEGLTRVELEDILTFANRAAAITCSRSGAIPAMPTLAEVEAMA